MNKMRIGVIGCGAISDIYIRNLQNNYDNTEVVAVSDLFMEKAKATQEKYGLAKAYTNEEMLADPEIDAILNLTIPEAHFDLNMAILRAGKHLFCEKPLALTTDDAIKIVELGKELGLRVCGAPDTFLGPGVQTCRKIIDEGLLGDIIGFSINLDSPGHEWWHPSPLFYYQNGGGPMRDMGPYYLTALVSLLGPVEEVFCYTGISFPQRLVKGQTVDVVPPTHYAGLMKLKNGAFGNVNMSFDVWHTTLPGLEIYGTKGMLTVPDPNMTGGKVMFFHGEEFREKLLGLLDENIGKSAGHLFGPGHYEHYREFPIAYQGNPNMRGIVTSEMAAAVAEGRPHRTSGEMVAHVVEIQESMEMSSNEGRPIKLRTTFEIPEAFYPVADGWWKGDPDAMFGLA